MPTSGSRGNTKRSTFRLRGKSAKSVDAESAGSPSECGEFLHIGPALAGNTQIQGQNILQRKGLGPRSNTFVGNCHLKNGNRDLVNGTAEPLQSLAEGHLQVSRSNKEKDKFTDRISLDRRGLSCIPAVVGEPGLRLLSLQHNLLSSLSGLNSTVDLSSLVFLDVYDNQIDKISSLETLCSLRVLLMGKNRIRRIDGLSCALKLEVLDLHGNRITQANGLKGLNELKVLNLAGNQLRNVELHGLPELRELNLKRNRLRSLTGCDGVPKLQKLYLSNNDLQSIDDISSVALALSLREVTLDNNPVSLGGDSVSFLVSYLPNLTFLSQMQVTDQVRRAAMAWRQNKEANNAAYNELGGEADANAKREQVISNARTNWELLRTQSKCLATIVSCSNVGLPSEYVLEANSVSKCETTDIFKANMYQVNQNKLNVNKSNITNKKIESNTSSVVKKNAKERRANMSFRSFSQDTDVSHSTSTSSELLKLPPILVPIIDSLDHHKINLTNEPSETSRIKQFKRWESISSVDPIINSSMSSLLTTTSESESEPSKKFLNKRATTANKKRATFAQSKSVSISDTNSSKTVTKNVSISDNSENMSIVSTGTNINSTITNSSTSGSDVANKTGRKELVRTGSARSRHIKSATTVRRNQAKQVQSRAVTAKPKPVKTVPLENNITIISPPESVVKEREQGGDWLVEVRGVQASVWGAGALRRLERAWPAANDVTTIHFHYVNFGSICTVLPTIKNRFPNAVHLSFRACGVAYAGQLGALAALRGISSLALHREGNPLASTSWHSYALYRLAHWGLCSLDHNEITNEQVDAANEEYSGLGEVVLWSLPDTLLQPLLTRLQGEKDNCSKQQSDKDIIFKKTYERDKIGEKFCLTTDNESGAETIETARSWIWNADSTLRDVVAKEALQWRRSAISQEEVMLRHRGRAHLSHVLSLAAGAALKLKLLRRYWPSLLLHLITTILYDFSQLQAHVDEKMRELQADLSVETTKKT